MSNKHAQSRFAWGLRAAAVMAAGLIACQAQAADTALDAQIAQLLKGTQPTPYSRLTTIQVPGNPLTSFDFTAVDPVLPLYYLSDRSNASVDVFDVLTNTFVTRIGGFVGSRNDPATGQPDPDISGPADVQPTYVGEVWATDGDSTVKAVNLLSQQIVATISTLLPGQTADQALRADGMSWDPRDQVLVVQNGGATPPFITFISTDPANRRVLGHIVYGDAVGAEASVYDPVNGLFYVNLPQVGDDPNAGAVSVVNPRTLAEVKRFPLTGCNGAGIALAPGQKLLVGCSLGNNSQIISAKDGTVLAVIPQVSGSDQVAYNPGDGNFYLAARDNPAAAGGPVLGVIAASTNSFITNVPSNVSAHAVSADARTNHVFLPSGPIAGDAACASGCIQVFEGKGATKLESTVERFAADILAE